MRYVIWLWLVPFLAVAQPAARVRNIRQAADTTQPSSDPQGLIAFKGGVVFSALRGAEREPWFSDGTPAGTVQLEDAWLGPDASAPGDFTVAGDRLFFSAAVGDFRTQLGGGLFVSDGTPGGTRLVRRVPELDNLAAVGSNVFFSAQDSSGFGFALWKSDGTFEGTVQVKSLGGANSSFAPVSELTAVGNTLFLTVYQNATGGELWKSDGTEEGTVLVKDVRLETASSSPQQLTAVGSTLFFVADDGVSGGELWKSDGTEAGTVMVKNIAPSGSSGPFGLTAVGSTLFFFATNGTNGTEPWKSDGTPDGTVMVKDIKPGSAYSVDYFNHSETAVGSTFFFTASDGTTGIEVWKTDGTAAGTQLVKRVGSGFVVPEQLTAVGGTLFFTCWPENNIGTQLWKSDGTAAGTVPVKVLPFVSGSMPAWGQLTGSAGRLFFTARTAELGQELWTSDGTEVGTVALRDIHQPNSSSEPREGVALGGVLLFAASDGTSGTELWRTDGTGAGTTRVLDIQPGSGSSNPVSLTRVGGAVYFVANDGTSGAELWRTDGTAQGTRRVKDVMPGTGGSEPTRLTAWGQSLYFIATDGSHGAELWKTDGTEAGTVLLKDVWSGSTGGVNRLTQPLVANGALFFEGNNGTSGWELWKTDGTAQGTVMVKDSRPGSEGLAFNGFTLGHAGGTVFVSAWYGRASNSFRYELWRSDGTSGGTYLLTSFPSESSIGSMVEFRGSLFFVGTGHQLWRSDGTLVGTYMVKDWRPQAPPTWYYGGLKVVGSSLFFTADDGVSGTELWKSDGTAAGTVRATDLAPGPDSSVLGPLIASQHTLWFAGSDGTEGVELWQTDGTAQGTRRVHDIAAGAFSSNPGPVAVVNGRLFFAATDADGDRELWALSVDSTPPRIVAEVRGTPGKAGWYTSDVSVVFQLSDDESPVTEPAGCEPATLTTDTAGSDFTCTASSWAGSATSRVTVKRDATQPTLSCPDTVRVEATSPAGAPVSFPALTAQDAVDPAPTVTTSTASGGTRALGTAPVTVTAEDAAGNTRSCDFLVEVRDTTPPNLTCPREVNAQPLEGDSAEVSYSVSASDIADTSPRVEYSHASGSRFPVGQTLVTVSAKDASGNEASCTFPVEVSTSGCGCTSTDNASLAGYGLLLLLALASKGRRRGRA
jgi:MYXO-CTERM domain-containing protein